MTRVEHHLRLHAYPVIGGLRLGAARRADLQLWVTALVHKQGLAPSSVRSVVAVVSSVLAHAVKDGLIPRNPCVGLSLPEVITEEVVIPSTEQLSEILTALRSDFYRRLVLAACGSGLRSGELRGLTEDRVDWLRRTVKVDRQLAGVTDDGQPVWGPPKTDAGNRTVPVAQAVIDVLAAQIAECGRGPGGLIFTGRNHQPITTGTLSKMLSRTLDPLGWPDGTGLHIFRHYYASLLIHRVVGQGGAEADGPCHVSGNARHLRAPLAGL